MKNQLSKKEWAKVPNGTIIHRIKDATGEVMGDVEKVEGGFYIHRGPRRANLGRLLTMDQAVWITVRIGWMRSPNYMDWKLILRKMEREGIQ